MMGGSLGAALRGLPDGPDVVGYDTDAAGLARAVERGAIDRAALTLSEAAGSADLVILGTPASTTSDLLPLLAAHAASDALVTDLASVKTRIVDEGERLFGARFLGGHPMAGGTGGGVDAADASLFRGATWALVRQAPFDIAGDLSASRLALLVTQLGARPVAIDAALHDRVVALVSHLPHLISFAFARTVDACAYPDVARMLAGASYRDMVRVAESDAALWADIMAENRVSLDEAVGEFARALGQAASAVSGGDRDAIRRAIERQAVV